jgi:hypothetical protein
MRRITIEELARLIWELIIGEGLCFFLGEYEMTYEAAKHNAFEGDYVTIIQYGGGQPHIIDWEYDCTEESQETYILQGLQQYIHPTKVGEIFISEMPSLDKQVLLTKEALLRILKRGRADASALAVVADIYKSGFGVDPTWRISLFDGRFIGGYVVPVREGWLCIPYDKVDDEGRKHLVLDAARFLDTVTCANLAEEMGVFAGVVTAVQCRIKRELQGESSI